MMIQTVYSIDGKKLRDIELEDAVFGLPVNEDVIWYAITTNLPIKDREPAVPRAEVKSTVPMPGLINKKGPAVHAVVIKNRPLRSAAEQFLAPSQGIIPIPYQRKQSGWLLKAY